jgi:hypothetical protein
VTKQSDYTIKFDSNIDVSSKDGCYVKYTFPEEMNLSKIQLAKIQGTGMLVGQDGEKAYYEAIDSNINLSEDDGLAKWLVIEGCVFDPASKS